MAKRPVNLTLNETVIEFAERIMEATGESSMVGLVEQLIREEYQRRNGPITLRDAPTPPATIPAVVPGKVVSYKLGKRLRVKAAV